MHDQSRPADAGLLRYLIARIDALEEQVRQLSRVRDAVGRQARHDPIFAVLNEPLVHAGSALLERLQRKEDGSAWERSGDIFTAHDIFLNTDDDFVETKTICTVIHYDGLEVIDSIYCRPSDWLED